MLTKIAVMSKLLAGLFAALALTASADGVQYEVPKGTVDVRVIELDGHKYVVGSATGESGAAVSVLHFEGCGCKGCSPALENPVEARRNAMKFEQGPRLFPKSMRLRKYEEQQGICPHCTNRFEFAEMQGDHIVPYSKGGKTEYSNLQMLCAPCNRKKSNRYSY